jgi:hypothetical protein
LLIVIILYILSVNFWPKVITLSVFNCILTDLKEESSEIGMTGGRLTEIHLIEIVIFQLIESFNNELIHI